MGHMPHVRFYTLLQSKSGRTLGQSVKSKEADGADLLCCGEVCGVFGFYVELNTMISVQAGELAVVAVVVEVSLETEGIA
jgi:hypothetical protein